MLISIIFIQFLNIACCCVVLCYWGGFEERGGPRDREETGVLRVGCGFEKLLLYSGLQRKLGLNWIMDSMCLDSGFQSQKYFGFRIPFHGRDSYSSTFFLRVFIKKLHRKWSSSDAGKLSAFLLMPIVFI